MLQKRVSYQKSYDYLKIAQTLVMYNVSLKIKIEASCRCFCLGVSLRLNGNLLKIAHSIVFKGTENPEITKNRVKPNAP